MCDSIPKQFSTAEVAAALGVGESSVKRWIDAGKLAAEKTPGGHRRVGLAELYSFLLTTGRRLADPEAVGLHRQSGESSRRDPIEICRKSLELGDAFTLESAMQVQRINEDTPASIIDRTLYPAFQKLRATCQHPSEECMVLHRAILMVQAALRATLAPHEKALGPSNPRIVLADIGYEVDGLPTSLAEAAIWDRAHCLQLGTNVPTKVIEGALEGFSADVLWLSASGPAKKRRVHDDWSTIVGTAERLKVKTVAFGDAVPLRALGLAGTRVASFSEFRGFVTALASIKPERGS